MTVKEIYKSNFLIHKRFWVLCILLLFLFLFSCAGDEKGIDIPLPPVEETRSFTLTIQIPGTSVPVTYALTPNEEDIIETVDVLLFKVSDKGIFFYKHIPVEKIVQPGSASNIKQFNISLEDMDTQIVVLANVRHMFTSELCSMLTEAALNENVVKAELMKHFIFEFTSPWNTGQIVGAYILPFPMYGESDIISKTATNINEIKMKRSVCRIDVGISNESVSVGDFENSFMIDSVFVFHAKDRGYVAPFFDGAGAILETPNIPSASRSNETYFGYKYESTNEKGINLMERTIYIPEDTQSSEKPTALVIKGKYNEGESRYYRINLKNKEGRRIPFLRNYRYRVTITGISGEGFLSAFEASVSPVELPTFIDANELELTAMEFNDDYLLGLSTDKVNLEEKSTFMMNVYTTYTQWSITWKDDRKPDWIGWIDTRGNFTEDGNSVFPSSVTSLHLQVKEGVVTDEKCRATLIIRAGTLFREVFITCGNEKKNK